MAEPYFVKLVRDDVARHVPDAAVTFGAVPRGKLHDLLKSKLIEEATEYIVAPSLGELADIYEVVEALASQLGHEMWEVRHAAMDKRRDRGGFFDGVGMFCTTTDEAERLNSHALKVASEPTRDEERAG
jgi:predicted house-cleaning noncanonical NTP pyrophosphatase (MazG superfamily)